MAETPLKILMVDDSPEDREMYRRFLQQDQEHHYVFVETDSGTEGVELYWREQPDCVLLDYQLPDLDGLAFLAELEHEKNEKSIPVIMLTGEGDEAIAVEAMKSGAQDYLVKDAISRESLYLAVHNAMEKVAMFRQLVFLARCDELTGLYNRRYFMDRLTEEVLRSRRYGYPLCIMLMDLDHFKSINDTHGHLMGDQVLATVGHLLREAVRLTDIPGRYGGEELCVVLTGTPLDRAHIIAERLRQRVAEEEFRTTDGTAFHITCSIGLAQFRPDLLDITAVLALADQALYQAKDTGRNRVVLATMEKSEQG
jgi:diguanylate cyclase (GGDEF)-like protein